MDPKKKRVPGTCIYPYVCTSYCIWLSLLLDVPSVICFFKKQGHWPRRRFLIFDWVLLHTDCSITAPKFLVAPGKIRLNFRARALAYGIPCHERTGSVLCLCFCSTAIFILVLALLSRSLLLIVVTQTRDDM